MRRYVPGALGLVLLVVLLLGASLLLAREVSARRNMTVICRTSITAGLTDGPNAPLDLSGDVTLFVKRDQSFTGELILKRDGSTVGIKGRGAGNGIDIVFEPAGGRQLFAHGVQEHSIWDCEGNAGGPLVGPDYGDQGDWTNYPPYIRVISGTVR